jgi:hypothetical protein
MSLTVGPKASSAPKALSGAVLILTTTLAFSQTGPLFRFDEKTGPHAVGLKVVEQYDYSRTFRHSTDEFGKPYQGERARPLQTLVWYPAGQNSAKPMTVGDYVNLWATETSFGHPKISARMKEWLAGMGPSLGMSQWAIRDAAPAPGRFPLVIYAPGASDTSWENIDLCEYLASHGYVVIASTDMGTTTRDMTIDLAGINTLATDISFLIGYAQSLPDTDMSAVAVVGDSWGGMANVFAAARDSRIDSLVALDGSLRYYPALVKQAGDVHPEQLTLPLLYFAQGYFSLEDRERLPEIGRDGPDVLNAWTHGDLITARMLGLAHAEFSSTWQRSETFWTDYPWLLPGDYVREHGIAGYVWMARYALQFLNAYLKHDESAVAFLKRSPAENGAPRHVMAVDFRPAKGIPASFDGFRSEIGRQGFDHAGEIYRAMQKDQIDFKLDEVALNYWANELIDDGHLPEALALLKLNAQIHPDSSAAHANLADAYLQSGQRELAADSYKTSLEKDTSNSPVKRKLGELKSGTSK